MIKPLRKLPTLLINQFWCCEGGCDVITPKLHENAYSLKWDNDGNLTDKKTEYYYTCQHSHLLELWDKDKQDTVDLDARFYEEIKPKFEPTLDYVNAAINDLESSIEQYNAFTPEQSKLFSGVEVSYLLTLKSGEEFSIYLEDFKALRDRLTMPKQVYVME